MGQFEMTNDVVSGWESIRPTADLSGLRVVQRLIWCGRLTEDLLERAAQAAGLRHRGDYEVLALLRRSDPGQLTPVEVADALLSSPSGMTGKLDRLEDQGLLERTRDKTDRRTVRLTLTSEGRDFADRTFDLGLAMYERMLSDLDAEQEAILDETLGTILRTLDHLYRERRPWESET